jgi:hypothetical protein
MDPESEIMARIEFAERGLTVVGWYHSHPTFEPTPSIRDIENQVNYQVTLHTSVLFITILLSLFYNDRHYLDMITDKNHLWALLSTHTIVIV